MATKQSKPKRKLSLHVQVRRALKKKGIKKTTVVTLLRTTRPTLDKYLQHGGFAEWQIDKLREENILPPIPTT